MWSSLLRRMSTAAGAGTAPGPGLGARTQDLPPAGGYQPIPYTRLPAKQYFKGRTLIAIYLTIQFGAIYIYKQTAKKVEREKIEMRSGRFAVMPLLLAERDRQYLKQLRINRDEEAKLMKDVPGWKVGFFYDEPIYHDIGEHYEPHFEEFFVHNPREHLNRRLDLIEWS